MSLTLRPAPTADRPAAEVRAWLSTSVARKEDGPEPDPQSSEFAKLLMSESPSAPQATATPKAVAADSPVSDESGSVQTAGLTPETAPELTNIPPPFFPQATPNLETLQLTDPPSTGFRAEIGVVLPQAAANSAVGQDHGVNAAGDLTPAQQAFQHLPQHLPQSLMQMPRRNAPDLATGPTDPLRDKAKSQDSGGLDDVVISIPGVPDIRTGAQNGPFANPIASPLVRTDAVDLAPAHLVERSARTGASDNTGSVTGTGTGTGQLPASLPLSAVGVSVPPTAPDQPKVAVSVAALADQGGIDPASASKMPNHPPTLPETVALPRAPAAPLTGQAQLFAAYAAMTNPDLPTGQAASTLPALSQPTVAIAAQSGAAGSAQIAAKAGADRSGVAAVAADRPYANPRRGAQTTPQPPVTNGPPARNPDLAQTSKPGPGISGAVDIVQRDSIGLTPIQSGLLHHIPGATPTEPAQTTHANRATALHVAAQLAQAAGQTGPGTTDITLNPRELGQVKLTLQAIDGTMFVAIAAERPETADLMRRNIDSLAQEFRGLGYQDVSFSFSGRQGGNGSGQDTGHAQPNGAGVAHQTDPNPDLSTDRYIPRPAAAQTGGTGLDLRL